jgi:hypothetical protein
LINPYKKERRENLPCLKLDSAAIAIIDDMMSNKSNAKTATDEFNLEKGAIFLTK